MVSTITLSKRLYEQVEEIEATWRNLVQLNTTMISQMDRLEAFLKAILAAMQAQIEMLVATIQMKDESKKAPT